MRGALCLEVAADYRFGAARAECHPFIIRQQEFESVRGDELLNWITIDLVESPRQFFQDRRLFVGRYGDVDSIGVKLAGLFFQIFQDAAKRLAFHRDQFGHQQAGEHAVFFRHMPTDAQSAGFLTADDDRFALHQRANVLEANRRLVNLDAEHFRNGVNLMACRYRPDDSTLDTPILAEMIQCEGQYLVWRKPGAVLVDHPEPVGVAVEPKREIGFAALDEIGCLGHSGLVGLG